MEVAVDRHGEVDQRVARQLLQHVVEEPDPRRHPIGAGAVEVDGHVDPRLGGVAADGRGAHRGLHSGGVDRNKARLQS